MPTEIEMLEMIVHAHKQAERCRKNADEILEERKGDYMTGYMFHEMRDEYFKGVEHALRWVVGLSDKPTE